jgi:hypothetical protein
MTRRDPSSLRSLGMTTKGEGMGVEIPVRGFEDSGAAAEKAA